jgi:hypothetical protein
MNKIMKLRGMQRVLVLVGVLSFLVGTVAPRRSDALVGIVASAPAAIVTGAVVAGVAVGASAIGLSQKGVAALAAVVAVSYFGIPALVLGLVVLPADLSAQYRFPELKAAPTGISDAELADYQRDRSVLEVLAQDVRVDVAHAIVSEDQWNSMTEAERLAWTEARRQQASQRWVEYVNEGLISANSLKVLAAITQE